MLSKSGKATAWKPVLLQLYRFAILAAIVLLVREHRTRLQIEASFPVSLNEIRPYFPRAAAMALDSEKMGLRVLDSHEKQLGYVVRTRPFCDSIVGYSGPTDTLVAFDGNMKVLGIKIRQSPDTFTHVGDVTRDENFMKTWDRKTWDEVAALDLKKAGVEGVSGATMTSMGIAESIGARMRHSSGGKSTPPPIRIRARDIGLAAILLISILISFSHLRGRQWARRFLQFGTIVYVGLINGDLIAQSLLSGWAAAGIGWRLAPGMVLLAAASFLAPWTTRRALYCQYICPHGAAQELLDRISPRKLRVKLPAGVANGLRWLPVLLLALTLGTTMLLLPLDLAGIEPFDAWLWRSAGWATITVAAVGLLASLFVPMAYCKFGCPTGALLEFVRSHGRKDTFGKRDVAAALMVLFVVLLFWNHEFLTAAIAGI